MNILTTVIVTIVILGISLLFKRKSHIMYLLPIASILISMILIGSAFMVGGWDGVGLLTIGNTLFLFSTASLIIVTLVSYFQTRKQS